MSDPKPPRPTSDPGLPSQGITVEITSTQGFLPVDSARLRGLVERSLRGEGVQRAAISVALVDDATIRRINRTHLGHDWPTDVISFILSEPDEPTLAGELVVSAEMARETAEEVGADPTAELSLYIVHGLLHLCGYDDATAEASAVMRSREEETLRREGLANTFSLVEGRRDGATKEVDQESGAT